MLKEIAVVVVASLWGSIVVAVLARTLMREFIVELTTSGSMLLDHYFECKRHYMDELAVEFGSKQFN